MPALIMVSPPAVEPVSLSELKEFLRVDAGDASQDNTLLTLGMTARTWAEAYTRRRLVQQTWKIMLDYFPGYYAMVTGQPSPVLSGPALLAGIRYAIVLPLPPVNAIVKFQYQNGNGVVTVMNPATDFLQDLQSNPARLTPPFGQTWPVARVVLNAVEVDFQVGYAMPVVLSQGSGPTQVAATGYNFQPSDIGRPISIPGAGPNGGTLNTVIASVSSPPDTHAVLRDAMTTAVTNVTGLLVNQQNGNPQFWEMAKTGIKFRVKADYNSLPFYSQKAKDVLMPMRDLRL